MNMPTTEQIKAWILNKMKRKRLIGRRHTDIKNIRKGAPPNFYTQIDDSIKELIKEGVIILKITEYGKQVSLNPRLMKEINEFILKHYTEEIFW
jgi:hypothetical protein